MTAADAAEIVAAVVESGETLRRYESWARAGFSISDALAYVMWWERAWEEGSAYYFAVEDPAGRLCGSCGLGQVDTEAHTSALGYWIRTSEAGKGLATAAVRALSSAAFEFAGYDILTIVAAQSNAASRRVAEKAGGVIRPGFGGTVFESGSQVAAVEYVLARPL